MSQRIETGQVLPTELSDREREDVRGVLFDYWLNEDGGRDFRLLSIEDQIGFEYSYLSKSSEGLAHAAARFSGFPRWFHPEYRAIVKDIDRKRQLLSIRQGQLATLWESEDERIRQEAGVSWSDLVELLSAMGLNFDPQTLEKTEGLNKFKRYRIKTFGTVGVQQNDGSVKQEPIVTHDIHIFGTTVNISGHKDIENLIKAKDLQDNLRTRIDGPRIDLTRGTMWVPDYTNIFDYNGWTIAGWPNSHYPSIPEYPVDTSQEFKYWEGGLVPRLTDGEMDRVLSSSWEKGIEDFGPEGYVTDFLVDHFFTELQKTADFAAFLKQFPNASDVYGRIMQALKQRVLSAMGGVNMRIELKGKVSYKFDETNQDVIGLLDKKLKEIRELRNGSVPAVPESTSLSEL